MAEVTSKVPMHKMMAVIHFLGLIKAFINYFFKYDQIVLNTLLAVNSYAIKWYLRGRMIMIMQLVKSNIHNINVGGH